MVGRPDALRRSLLALPLKQPLRLNPVCVRQPLGGNAFTLSPRCGDDAGVPDWKRRHPVAAFRVVALSFVILPAVVFGFAFGWAWGIVWLFVAAFFVSATTKWGRR